MIDIYICEDNPSHLSLFEEYISKFILIDNLDMKVVLNTSDPYSLLNHVLQSENQSVFFLDIDLQSDINGLQLAQKIRQLKPRCFIIFITSHSEMSFLTFQYKVEALDFIIKDTPEHIMFKIHECLLDIEQKSISLNNNISPSFTVKLGDRYIMMDYDDILFFETSSNIHKVVLHGKKRLLEFSGQLKDIEAQLDPRFYRCHRSYLINTDNISEINFDTLTVHMIGGELCPISVRQKKGLKNFSHPDFS